MAPDDDGDRAEALVDRLFGATISALELYSVYLGVELELYRALEEGGAVTPGQLAGSAGIDNRYAREWLEQQAVAGLLAVEEEATDGAERRYRLPPEHAGVLAHPDDENHVAPFAHLLAGIGRVLPTVAEAYRTGGGVPYSDYGADFRHGQGAINRPTFEQDLPTIWLDAMPDIKRRLGRGAGRVADVGCGQGWSTIAMAKAFPEAYVDGIDLDRASLDEAGALAEEAGLAERARFLERDAGALEGEGPYDLILVLEALHDFAQPVPALAGMRRALAEDGAVLVVDERVADRFTAPGDEVERMMYGWSVLHCLPTQLVESPSAATGTAMRADTLRRYAEEAGFERVEVLDVDNDLFRLYRLG